MFLKLIIILLHLNNLKVGLINDEWENLKLIDICGNYDEPTNPELKKLLNGLLQSICLGKIYKLILLQMAA